MRTAAPQRWPRIPRGFTLIETLVAALILTILSSVAWASYRNVLLRAHRGEARAALLQLQAAQERHYLDHLRYSGTLDAPPQDGGLGLPTTTHDGRYALGLVLAEDGQHYVASARPAPGSPQATDRPCASFGINESGETTATSAECWP
jgi:type IV pilus assembly protein PilE